MERDYQKAFGTLLVRKAGDRLLIQENPKSLPLRLAGNIAIVLLSGGGSAFFFKSAGENEGPVSNAYSVGGLVLVVAFLIAVLALGQLIRFVRLPITLDCQKNTAARGKRVYLDKKFRAGMKQVGGGEAQTTYHVYLRQKDKSLFLLRTTSDSEAKQMVNLINGFLGKSLPEAEVGENALDHVG